MKSRRPKTICYIFLATTTKNPTLCEKLNHTQQLEDLCYQNTALHSENHTICNKIHDPETKKTNAYPDPPNPTPPEIPNTTNKHHTQPPVHRRTNTTQPIQRRRQLPPNNLHNQKQPNHILQQLQNTHPNTKTTTNLHKKQTLPKPQHTPKRHNPKQRKNMLLRRRLDNLLQPKQHNQLHRNRRPTKL